MDSATILGLLLAVAALIGGHYLEGGSLGMILQITAMVIVFGGTKYLRELLDRYDGNVPMAVAAYNCGMANVEKGRLPQETRSYLQLVSRHYGGRQVLPKPYAGQPVPQLVPSDLPATET